MFWIKAWRHILASLKYMFYKLIYGKRLNIGKKTTWRKNFSIMISNKGSISIGSGCFFNNECSVNSIEKVVIGNGCIFGENVKIYDHNHRFNKSNLPIKGQGYSAEPVSIGDNCWVGSNSVILKGAHIGDKCVISAGSIVDYDVPSGYIVKAENEHVFEKIIFDKKEENSIGN